MRIPARGGDVSPTLIKYAVAGTVVGSGPVVGTPLIEIPGPVTFNMLAARKSPGLGNIDRLVDIALKLIDLKG